MVKVWVFTLNPLKAGLVLPGLNLKRGHLMKRKMILLTATGVAAALLLALIFIYREKISGVLTPFIIAGVISYIVMPAVSFLENRGTPRWVAILVAYTLLISFLAACIIFLFPVVTGNLRELGEVLPGIFKRYTQFFNDLISMIRYSSWSEDIKKTILQEIQNGLYSIQDTVTGFLRKAVEGIAGTLKFFFDTALAMVIAFYLINDAESFKKASLSLFPRRLRPAARDTAHEINTVISRFIRGQLLIALIVAAMETAGLYIIGLEYAVLLGLIGGIANIIPYFGPYIGAAPAVLFALAESPLKAVYAVIIFAGVQQIENSLITPRVIQDRLGLHPVTTILVILLGGSFFGLKGLLFAVPVTAVLRVVLRRAVNHIARS